MSDDHKLIGPGTPCTYCGGDYGQHYAACNRPKLSMTDLRKRATELAIQNGWTPAPHHHLVDLMLAFAAEQVAEQVAADRALVSNLAMLVRRLAYAVKRHGGHEIMVSQAVKFLKDNNLNGNILRDEYTEGAEAI